MLRKTVDVVLGEDLAAVDNDVKNAASPLDQLCVNSGLGLDGFRQTGGFGLVVSLNAISDGHVHRRTNLQPFERNKPTGFDTSRNRSGKKQ